MFAYDVYTYMSFGWQIGLAYCSETVSYTHLDVYKRQINYRLKIDNLLANPDKISKEEWKKILQEHLKMCIRDRLRVCRIAYEKTTTPMHGRMGEVLCAMDGA